MFTYIIYSLKLNIHLHFVSFPQMFVRVMEKRLSIQKWFYEFKCGCIVDINKEGFLHKYSDRTLWVRFVTDCVIVKIGKQGTEVVFKCC